MTPATAWRGIAAENADEITSGLAALLRRRARELLASLLRRQRGQVTLTLLFTVITNLAGLAGPWLVGIAIDRGIPPLLHGGNAVPLAATVAGFAAAVAVQAVASRAYIYSMGQLGEAVVLDLRGRLFCALPAAPGRLSRALHLGPGHLPAGVRRRFHRRPVR